MSDTATKPGKTRKPNVGSDPTKGARVRLWQIGFYAFAIGMSVFMIGVSAYYIIDGRFSRVFTAAAVLVTGLSWGLLTAKNDDQGEVEGLAVGTAEPELRALIADVASQVGAPMPDTIQLVTAAEFAMVESTRYFGRKIERSSLTIGLPYLASLTRQEFAAMSAYELAPFGDLGIDNGVEAARSLRSARDLIAKERQGFINGVYGSYARKMFRSVGGVGVAQEEASDRRAAELYGSEALQSALTKFDDVAVAYDQLLREYVVPALQRQLHPEDMFDGFAELLQSPQRADDRARKVAKRRAIERSPFQLQLTIAERLERLEAASPTAAAITVDDPESAARSLLDPAAKSSEIVVSTWASKLMTCRTEPQTWQQLVDEVYSVKTQSLASMVFDDDAEPDAQLEQAFEWSQGDDWGRVDESIEAGLKSIKDPAARRAKWARCVVVEAAAATGAFSWQHSWDGPPLLVDSAGRLLDATAIGSLIADGKSAEARAAFDAATH